MFYFPPPAFFFELQLDGGNEADAQFQEISGIEARMETEPYKEGGQNHFVYLLPVRTQFQPLVLKRGVADKDSKLWDWVEKTLIRDANLDNKIERKDITVRLLNPEDTGQALVTWTFQKAFPTKWSISSLNAQQNAVSIETIELVYETFSRQ